MSLFENLIFFLVSFGASTVGAICGLGGGVIIKPTLDLVGCASAAAVNFLSGCTVLAMTCYSVGKSLLAKEHKVRLEVGTPLAIGACFGGILGKQIYTMLGAFLDHQNLIVSVQSALQSVLLALVTLGVMIYEVHKPYCGSYHTHKISQCLFIGLFLGALSSFLGIGGGPINLMLLSICFSMDMKTAAANSLYIILFSQISSLATTIASGTVPEFEWSALLLMIAGGILGGMAGRAVNKKIDNAAVRKLYMILMIIIIGICIFNTWKYLH